MGGLDKYLGKFYELRGQVADVVGDDKADLVLIIGAIVAVVLVYQVFKPETVALSQDYQKFKIIRKEDVSHNTRRYRLALQTPETKLGLPVGKHMYLRIKALDGSMIERPYTPTSSDDELGYVELVIKIYSDGKLTAALDKLGVGDYIECMGPKGRIEYTMAGRFAVTNPVKKVTDDHEVTKINMIAGGTGLTPMYQIIQEIIKKSYDDTKVKMIFGNISEDDMLCRGEMEQFRKDKNIDVVFTLDKAPAGWKEESGYVDQKMIKKNLFAPAKDTVNLICGPPGMVKAARANLQDMGYAKQRIWTF